MAPNGFTKTGRQFARLGTSALKSEEENMPSPVKNGFSKRKGGAYKMKNGKPVHVGTGKGTHSKRDLNKDAAIKGKKKGRTPKERRNYPNHGD